MLLIMLGLYYTIATLTLLIYFNYHGSKTGVQSMIVLDHPWANLGFYGGNIFFYWAYTATFYHIFWVNNIQ
jgi:hypothetical protein